MGCHVPSFPRKRESGGGLGGKRIVFSIPFGIPAYAGMTVGRAPGSRLRGNDGGYPRPGINPAGLGPYTGILRWPAIWR